MHPNPRGSGTGPAEIVDDFLPVYFLAFVLSCILIRPFLGSTIIRVRT
jgi:hypothetical protein